MIEELRAFIQRQPFAPFTIYLADGRSFRVEHRDFLIIPPGRNMTVIIYKPDGSFDFVYVKLITGISSDGDAPTVGAAREPGGQA